MELKRYQKQVIRDVEDYIDECNELKDARKAYNHYWQLRTHATPGVGNKLHPYTTTVPGVPRVTIKVPTAGGKTFIACNALEKIFASLQVDKPKAVAWFVPSDPILEQTLHHLKDPSHPYRQRIDALFHGAVGVYRKEELLRGANFDPVKVREQLTIAVLSIDSFASQKKDDLRSYRENGYLQGFEEMVQQNPARLDGTDATALMQVLNALNPVVIIDESHNFRSNLRVEALQQINPSFILELTATPRDNSNIISYVDAKQLKDEHMVKLPVIVYNSRTKTDVILQSIQLRNSLEAMAIEAERQGGDYIRPIVLFQAQPRTSDDSETFDKIKQSLVAAGIPEEQIKIKTANQNELKGQDLMSRSCPVRYIITVNALKEGWDCPFAYILASLANRSSQVDVEQILGRILRLPYARVSTTDFLNMGYVFTSSADFNNTIQIILRGLQNAGFSARDYRAPQLQPDSTPPTPVTPQEPDLFGPDDEPTSIHESHSDYETPADEIHSDVLHKALQQAQTEAQTPPLVQDILTKAQQGNADYVQQLAAGGATDATNTLPPEAFETGRVGMKSRYAAEGAALRLPVFEMRLECKNPHLFETAGDAAYVPLEKTMLYSGFDLNRCDKNMDFQFTGRDVKQIDLEESGQDEFVPRVWTLNAAAIDRFKQYIQSLPTEGRVHQLAGKIADTLNFDCLTRPVLVRYIMDILSRLQEEELEQLTDNIGETIDLFKAKINGLLAAYAKQEFQKRLDVGKIRMNAEGYKLPQSIVVTNRDKSGVPHALYCEEEAFNGFETRVIQEIAGMPNVAFWHRNQERGKGFYINGFINHYPDFIVQMRNGMVLLIETKGGDRDNSDSQAKLDLGTAWANKAGANYRYYMVFENNETLVGALTLPKLLERLKQLD